MYDETRPMRRTFGPYTCIRLMGFASSNTVYYALHQKTGRLVALRVMPIIRGNVAEVISACNEQLTRLTELNVPNIVPIEDFGDDDESIYIATRVMQGGTLDARLKRFYEEGPESCPLPGLEEIAGLMERLAQALDTLHENGLVHGQLDPRSIMFDSQGQAYLADVGLTKLHKLIYGLESTNSFNMSKYSAPELWEGVRPQPASDQYSLACMIYELLTGRAPFDADTIYKLMQKHVNDVALPPHYVRKELPADLALPFWQALAKPPAKRHKSVMAFYDDYRHAIKDHTSRTTDFFTFELEG